jgi:formylglycine-generating enzyme required for sulfatase activity
MSLPLPHADRPGRTAMARSVAVLAGAVFVLAAGPRYAFDQTAAAQGYRETVPDTTVAFEMVPVPGGTVTVGGTAATVEPFFIGRTEVTWDLYDLFMFGRDEKGTGADAVARPSQPYGAPDYNWGHNGYPVISVTREAAEAFCIWLSARTGKKYRLPSEAEWMRAAELASAGGSARDALAWHSGNAKGTTHPVGKRQPDTHGLYDLFGNAAEWVITTDDARVTRGGSFRDAAEAVGPAARAPYDRSWQERDPQLPKSKWWLSDGPFVGFRLAADAKGVEE